VLLVMVVARIAFNTAWLLPGKALHYGVHGELLIRQ